MSHLFKLLVVPYLPKDWDRTTPTLWPEWECKIVLDTVCKLSSRYHIAFFNYLPTAFFLHRTFVVTIFKYLFTQHCNNTLFVQDLPGLLVKDVCQGHWTLVLTHQQPKEKCFLLQYIYEYLEITVNLAEISLQTNSQMNRNGSYHPFDHVTSLYDVVLFCWTFSHTFIEKCLRPFPLLSPPERPALGSLLPRFLHEKKHYFIIDQ